MTGGEKLNLPRTDFPMRAGLPRLEPDICNWWQSDDFRNHLAQKLAQRPQSFLLHDGPPYANGEIHTGHAINKVLKDIIVKSHWLNGEGGLYVPGWDCHGLPIELRVEEMLGDKARQLSRSGFRATCRQYAMEQVEVQKAGFLRLGVQGEWQQPYLTADAGYEADMLRALAEIVRRGHLKRGQKPVHWCTACQSALAEAEVEYEERTSNAVDVAFAAVDAGLGRVFGFDGKKPGALVAWTTTPWTLLASQALCVHPDLHYCAVRPEGADDHFVVAVDLVASTARRCGWKGFQSTASVAGSQLVGLQVAHPFQSRSVPIIAADHVTLEVGTGVVHTAPAHGLDDWRVGQEHGLEIRQLVQSDGTYHESLEDFGGMHVQSAEKPILDRMRKLGTLLAAEPYEHSYPHCWRHHLPLIFRATAQWFIGMREAGLLDDALEAAKAVDFVPKTGRERFLSMLENRPDWCISRQRIWGVPLALLQHKKTGEAHRDTAEVLEKVADLIQSRGLDAWEQLSPDELVDDGDAYEKCTDVLDVWFDSGASNWCVLAADDRLRAPADMYLEGTDQHRGWFQSSMLVSVATGRGAPYRCLLTHGFLVDENGNKMSKSRGNGLLPDEIWDQLGADILRLWIASTDYRGEMVLSKNILASTADIYRKIRNTIRFMLGNLHDFPGPDAAPSELVELDSWALARAAKVQLQLQQEYAGYRLHNVCRILHDFCAADMGAFYLDILKDRLYTCRADGASRRSAQFALWHIVRALVRWIAPVLSFTAEEAWYFVEHPEASRSSAFAGARSSVLGEAWHRLPDQDGRHQIDWAAVRRIRDAVNLQLEEARNAKRIGGSLTASVIVRDADMAEALEPLGEEVRFALLVSGVELRPQEPGEGLEVVPAQGHKCSRCWHRIRTSGSLPEPFVCERCQRNLAEGEQRRYA